MASIKPDLTGQIDILNQITLKILGNKNVIDISRSILSTMKSHLDAYGGVIYFHNEEKNALYTYAFSQNSVINKALASVAKNWQRYSFPVESSEQLLSKCFRTNKVYVSTKLSDFYDPVVNKKHVELIQRILGVKMGIALPIRIKEKPSGVLFMAFKNRKKLTKTDWSLIHFYTNLSSIAIDNHMKYTEVQEKYEMEKETTSILSHELKTPIAIAQNSTHNIMMLLEKYRKEMDEVMVANLVETAGDIQQSMERLVKICTSIFHLREVETNVPLDVHKVDLERQIGPIIEMYKKRCQKKGLKLKSKISHQKGSFHAGIVQLEQIITILLDNALKYTEKGGIGITINQGQNDLMVTISDTGYGIPKNKRKAIFGRFYRNISHIHSKKPEGLGLGLYICKKILDQIEGEISVTNNPEGKGTIFTVTIPTYQHPKQARKKAHS